MTDPSSPGEGRPRPACRWLRARSRYGRSIDGVPWESGLSPVEAYWCLRTSEPMGPDDAPVHATWCGAGRGCFEEDPAERETRTVSAPER